MGALFPKLSHDIDEDIYVLKYKDTLREIGYDTFCEVVGGMVAK